jgi:hypothetical protein
VKCAALDKALEALIPLEAKLYLIYFRNFLTSFESFFFILLHSYPQDGYQTTVDWSRAAQ